jgi:hypothetical protein
MCAAGRLPLFRECEAFCNDDRAQALTRAAASRNPIFERLFLDGSYARRVSVRARPSSGAAPQPVAVNVGNIIEQLSRDGALG